MRQASTRLKNLIANGKLPEIDVTLYLPQQGGGTTLSPLLRDDSISWHTGNSNGGTFTIGGCNISTFSFTCLDTEWSEYDWTDSYFDVVLKWTSTTAGRTYIDTIEVGRFYVGTHDCSLAGISVIGYDALLFLDNQTISADDFTQDNITASDAIDKILEHTPILLSDSVTIPSVSIHKNQIQTCTKRLFLQQVLQMGCSYCFMTRANLLVIKPYVFGLRTPSQHVYIDDIPIFSESRNKIAIDGFVFTSNDESEPIYIGSTTGYIVEMSNPLVQRPDTSGFNSLPFLEFFGRTIHAGEITTLANPLVEPGDIYAYRSWVDSAGEYFNEVFFANQIVWNGKNSRMTVRCEAERSQYNDRRSIDKESEGEIPNVFASGTITLNSYSTAEPNVYQGNVPSSVLNQVPSRYRASYVCIATPVSSGTVLGVSTSRYSCVIYGDTQNMEVAYQLCRNTTDSSEETASVLTDYGSMGANYFSNIEEEYTT